MTEFKQSTIRRFLVWALIVSLAPMGLMTPAQADVVTSEDLAYSMSMDVKRDQIKSFVARDEVRNRLLDMGVDLADVDSRIDSLTDAEVLQMQEHIDEMPAGGVFGTIIAILVIFILLDVAGVTDIFPAV